MSSGPYSAKRNLMVRAVHRPQVDIPALPDLSDRSVAGVRAWCAWIRQVWSVPQIAEAVGHATPALARKLDLLVAGEYEPPADDAWRLVVSLVRYTLRARHRPTPFGLFAGVAEGRFGKQTAVRWGEDHQGVARADGAWLAGIIQTLEGMPQVRQRLRLTVSNIVQPRGERLVLPWRPRGHDETGTAVHEVSLRCTTAVRAVVRLAAAPVLYTHLARKLAAEVPGLDDTGARTLLDVLISHRVLITSLQPPSTEPDALGHVLAQLNRSGADKTEQAAGLSAALREIHQELHSHNRQPVRAGRPARAALTTRMQNLSACEKPLALDLRLDCDVTLPWAVAREAENAADLLARVSPEPYGSVAWARYRRAFREHYGEGVLVPLSDVLNSLGLPEGFHGTPPAPRRGTDHRDAVLLTQVQQTLLSGSNEIVLDDNLVDKLALGRPTAQDLPAHLELLAEVHASSPQDLDAGRFRLAVRRTSRGWGHLTGGRFAALLSQGPVPSDLLAALGRRPTTVQSALPVQLAYPALRHAATPVSRTPQLAPVISLAEHRRPAPGLIPLSDLALVCYEDRLHLVSRSRGQVLEAASLHPLQIEYQTPALARFLDELQRGQSCRLTGAGAELAPWDWGAARRLPVRPRVSRGRILLAPASWRLADAGLPGPEASTAQWEDALSALRQSWRIPSAVYLERYLNRIRLDLDNPEHRAFLRDYIRRPSQVKHSVLTEAEPPGAFGWCERPTEIVTLLAARGEARSSPPLAAAPVADRGDSHLPGASPYLAARFRCPAQAVPHLLTDHLPGLAAHRASTACWITLAPHTSTNVLLVLRLDGPAAASGMLDHLGPWASRLAASGLAADFALVPYQPQVGVWGSGSALTASENVLAADCRAVSHQLAQLRGIDPNVLAAASLVAIAAGFHRSAPAGLAWLASRPKPPSAPPLPRHLLRQAQAMATPSTAWPALRKLAGGQLLADLWTERHTALTEYRTALDHSQHPDPDTALDTLLHHHLSLTSTPDAGPTATPWRLARQVALAATRPRHR